MHLVRALFHNLLFYLFFIVCLILFLPVLVLPRPAFWWVVNLWSHINAGLLRLTGGIRMEMRGLENVPKSGAIIAAKHQSTWETLFLLPYLNDPAFILKRELMRIPVFGWFLLKARMIPVDRTKGREALVDMTRRVGEEIGNGRQIIIFPEGTRRPPGAEPIYKHGIAYLYGQTGAPVIPVALNSGLYWPRRKLSRFPGTIVVEFLPAIAPGLPSDEMFARMRDSIEAASDRLLLEAVAANPALPLPPEAQARIAALRADAG